MSKHTIVGTLGLEDYNLHCRRGEYLAVINFIKDDKWFDYGIEDIYRTLYRYGFQPSELGTDILMLASLVYAADTRISRAEKRVYLYYSSQT